MHKNLIFSPLYLLTLCLFVHHNFLVVCLSVTTSLLSVCLSQLPVVTVVQLTYQPVHVGRGTPSSRIRMYFIFVSISHFIFFNHISAVNSLYSNQGPVVLYSLVVQRTSDTSTLHLCSSTPSCQYKRTLTISTCLWNQPECSCSKLLISI